jgi:CRP-like cAMP-binding protein
MSVKRSRFETFFQANPGIVYKILQTIAQQRNRLENRLVWTISRQDIPPTPDIPRTGRLAKVGFALEDMEFKTAAWAAYDEYLRLHPGEDDAEQAAAKKDALAIEVSALKKYKSGDVNRTYDKGSSLFLEGESEDDSLFLILSGKVEAWKMVNDRLVFLGILRSGNVLGESSLFTKPAPGAVRNYTAIATETTKTLAINSGTLKVLMEKRPKIVFHLVSSISGRVWFDIKKLIALKPTTVPERLNNMLALTLQVAHINLGDSQAWRFYFSGKELLNMTDCDNDEGRDILKRASAQGLLVEEDGCLQCKSVAELPRFFSSIRSK